MTMATNRGQSGSAALHATAPRGYDAAAVLQAGALLAKSPGSFQSVFLATGVPVEVLRAAYPAKREPYRHVPLARPVTAEDWRAGRVGQVRIPYRISATDIIATVAAHFDLPEAAVTGRRRTGEIARPRQIAMYLCRQHTPLSFPEIARALGGKDHTTIIHGVRRIEELLGEDDVIANHVAQLNRKLSVGARRLDHMILRTEKRLEKLKALRRQVVMV
ncbi:helix-turn-helix domain-containing protein [Brevundimonas diminuta]|uniref:helix-turn-helix domain-containing protein n=1 Tax=Brevundimonas diminuta TaxID=293 RepID=UPI00320A58CD